MPYSAPSGMEVDAASREDASQWPREIPCPEGLPAGWKCIENKYKSGRYEGQFYLRFISPAGQHGFLSQTAVVRHDAEVHGRDVDAALKAWEKQKAALAEKRSQEVHAKLAEAAALKRQREEEEKIKNKKALFGMLTAQGKPADTACETCSAPSANASVVPSDVQTPPRQSSRASSDDTRRSSHKRRASEKSAEVAGQQSLVALSKKRRENDSGPAETAPPEKEAADSASSSSREALLSEIERVRASKRAASEAEEYDVAMRLKTQEVELTEKLQKLEDTALLEKLEAIRKELEEVRTRKKEASAKEEYDVAMELKRREIELEQQLTDMQQPGTATARGQVSAKQSQEASCGQKDSRATGKNDGSKPQATQKSSASDSPATGKNDGSKPQAAQKSSASEAKPGVDKESSGHLHPASVAEFFQFLQCQLCMEAREVLEQQVELKDPDAKSLWKEYEAFVTPNLGKTERWVPYHTIFGVHELFLVESVHHRVPSVWTEKQRFLTMFIFRAHCKRDFFNKAQLPHLLKEEFWENPLEMFRNEGPLEQSMLNYRRTTKQPLVTSCFRMIPERVLKDDDENLVRSIVLRTQTLLPVAEQLWQILKNGKLGPAQKFTQMSNIVQAAPRLGETWAKMLMVCIDLAYPEEQLLESQCDVGIGALPPLRALLPNGGASDATQALKELTTSMNGSKDASARHFWESLPHVEQLARKKFEGMTLIEKQACTKVGDLNNVTVQVQLCEYRQFRNFLARKRYGLEKDDTMKVPEKQRQCHRFGVSEERQCIEFEFSLPDDDEPTSFEVPFSATKGHRRHAERVVKLCLQRFSHPGADCTKSEVDAYLQELYTQFERVGKEDVPEDSEAWRICRVQLHHPSPLCAFAFIDKSGTKIPFQTTVKAAGGNVLECERIARLCWAKLEDGATREQVLAYRSELYEKCSAGPPVQPAPVPISPVIEMFKRQKLAN